MTAYAVVGNRAREAREYIVAIFLDEMHAAEDLRRWSSRTPDRRARIVECFVEAPHGHHVWASVAWCGTEIVVVELFGDPYLANASMEVRVGLDGYTHAQVESYWIVNGATDDDFIVGA